MIGFFPSAYPDELLYSQLCRYYQRAGYVRYLSAAEDLFVRKTARVSIEYINHYNEDAMRWITRDMPFEEVIKKHTMFPAYMRFFPLQRRKEAFKALTIMDRSYINLICLPSTGVDRHLRYCPLCAEEDREKHGETYWHREHQIIGIDVCPKHGCFLKETGISLKAGHGRGFIPAETEVPEDELAVVCNDERRKEFTNYAAKVFHMPVDLKTDVDIGALLHERIPKGYRYKTGRVISVEELYADLCSFYGDGEKIMTLQQTQRVFHSCRFNSGEVLWLAFFLGIPAEEVAGLAVGRNVSVDPFCVTLAEKYGVPYQTAKAISEEAVTWYRRIGRVDQKRGPRPYDWSKLDEKYYPQVVMAVDQILQTDKPQRVNPSKIEKTIGITAGRLKRMPKSLKYVQDHTETTEEFHARKIKWAEEVLKREGKPVTPWQVRQKACLTMGELQGCSRQVND